VATSSPDHLATLLDRARQGEPAAVEEFVPVLYHELRRIAARSLRRERPGQTLQPTALVHEAYLRLLRDEDRSFQNRAHFLAIAARSMREILVEHARARGAQKRGGHRQRVTLDEDVAAGQPRDVELVALDAALERLEQVDATHARIVELKFFGGLTNEETAEALGVSPATVKRGWAMARAWLFRELSSGPHE
jgi:RNA polymerase sigma factor (TIGR02999 family)